MQPARGKNPYLNLLLPSLKISRAGEFQELQKASLEQVLESAKARMWTFYRGGGLEEVICMACSADLF